MNFIVPDYRSARATIEIIQVDSEGRELGELVALNQYVARLPVNRIHIQATAAILSVAIGAICIYEFVADDFYVCPITKHAKAGYVDKLVIKYPHIGSVNGEGLTIAPDTR